MKKLFLNLIILCFFSLSVLGQKKAAPSIFKSKADKNNYASESGTLYFKAGLLNVFHPTAPSLDLGLEFMLTKRLGLEFMYGLRSPRIIGSSFKDRLYLDRYYKLFGGFKLFFDERWRLLGRSWNFKVNYIALEGYYSSGNGTPKANFALDESSNSRLDYQSADIDKQVYGISLKQGFLYSLSKRLELESSFGVGAIFYKRDYTFFSPLIRGQTPSDETIGPYDDRNMGTLSFVQGIVNLKVNYRIF